MSHNRKVLKTATKELGKAKAPAKPKDKLFSMPVVSTEGYKQGPPPSGSHYRIPGNGQSTSIYNPTPYPLDLVGPNGTHAQIGPWDYDTQNFNEPYMDEFHKGENYIDYEDDLDEEQIAELRAGGYTVEDISVPQLTQAQKGITISDPKEYAYRKAAYNDSLSLYNQGIKDRDNYIKYLYKNGYDVKDHLERWNTNGWVDTSKHPTIGAIYNGILENSGGGYDRDSSGKPRDFTFYPLKNKDTKKVYDNTAEGKLLGKRYSVYKKPVQPVYFDNTNPFLTIKPTVKTKSNNTKSSQSYKKKYPDILVTDPNDPRIGQYSPNGNQYVLDVSKYKEAEILERKPLPEIGRLPSRIPVRETPEIVPQDFKYTPKKQEPIKVANRSQTVMEPDPDRPGKYRVKEMRQVPYSAKFPGEGTWEPANTPRVIYVDAEGNETEERPGAQLNTLDLQGETFKQGGSLLTKKVTCKKCGWEWDAADGGNDITTCHKCGGQGLIHAQNGISTPYYSYNNEEPTSYDPITQTINFNEESLLPPEGFTGNLKQFIDDEYRAQNAHENFHHWQNQTGQGRIETGRPDAVPTFPSNQEFEGDHYYNRREIEEKQKADEWRKAHPNESSFINPDILYNKVTNAAMYDDPNTLEGQARLIEEKVRENKSHQPFNLINPGLTNPWKKQNNVGLVHAKKGGSLKKYSRSIEATNKLFHISPLLKKAKSKKKKIFDPNSQYFQEGGNYFSYEGRPDARYMKKNDGWYINTPHTNDQYIKIEDPTGSRTKLLNEQAIYHAGDKAKTAPFSAMSNVMTAVKNMANPINNDILKVGESVSGGGYNKAFAGSGTPFVISHNGQEILAAATDGTYCSGYTCGVAMKTMQQRGLLDNMTPDQLKNFQKTWYGAKDFEKGKSETLSTKALEDYNLGKRIEHKAAKPGDIAQIWRNNGSGHSVIFKDWVTDDKGNRIGIKYRSSQANTKGIGDRTEIFGTKIDPNRIYVARLHGHSKGGDVTTDHFQDGGSNTTKLTNKEEEAFQKFYPTLPDNLMQDDPEYDIRGYWDSEGRPETFDYNQPKQEDGYHHAYSINSKTGEYLKSPTHPTFQHAVDEDRKMGYRPLTNVQGRNIATENPLIADEEQRSFLTNTEGPVSFQKVGGIPNLPLREGRAAYERLGYTDNDRMAMAAEGGTSNNYIEVDADDNDIANYIAQGYQVEELPKAQYAGQTPFVHPDAGATNVLFQKPTTTKPNSKYNKNTPVNYQAKLKPVVADNTRDVTADNAVFAKQINDYMGTDEYKANQKAEKEAQVQFEKEQWDKYNKMSFGEKVLDRTNAALNQPLLMAANALMGDQAYIPGMAEGLGEEGPDYDKWLKATGQERGLGVNDVFSAWNPGNWGGHAGREYGEGNYVQGAAELGLGLLGLKGAPLMGNQLAKSSANKLINLEQKAGQALSTPKNLINNLSKSKNIKQAVGSFAGVPPEGALPRMSSDELKTFRKIQEIGRMQSKFAPISEQYEYALKQGIPDEHLQQVFGKSREEIESAISILQEQEAIRRATPISARETIDLSRQPTEGVVTNDFRRITAESTPEEIAGFADHMNMLVDQLRGLMERSAATNRSNIIRHALEDNHLLPPPEELILNTSRRQTISDEDIARFVSDMAPPEGQFRVYSDFSRRNNAVNLYGQNKSFSLPKINEDRLINFSSAYPMYKGRVIQNVPSLSLRGSGSLKNVSDKVASESTANINSGDVFTGSLNTSHSSYLPQLKQTFKYTEGAPQFVGYQPMNSLGFLSDFHYSNDDIAKYLNTEIDEQIKRGIVPKDILRPYIQHNKPNRILLPHYGIKQFEDGGSLELDLGPEEIQAYKDGGYIVEELPHAQEGVATPRKKIINYVPNVKEVESISPMSDMFNKFKQLKTVAQAKPQQKVAPVKPMVLPSWMEHAVNTPTVAKPVEPLQLPSWMTHAINTANVSAPESEYRIPINSNAPIGIPASASNMNTQPIQNNFANNFTNTGIPRQIDYNHLATNEAKRLNTKGMKEVPETPSFLENVGNFLGNVGPGNWADNYYENNEEYINRYLEKKGVINPTELKFKPKDIKTPEGVKTYYQELGTNWDDRSSNPTDSLLSYRNQFDANKGFTYFTTPVKKDRTHNEVYNNVEGVGNFVLDASPNFEKPYIHANNFSYLRDAIKRNDFIPIYESTGTKGEAKLTYKRAKDIDQKILNKIIETSGKISSTTSETERQNIANEVTPFLYRQKTKVISPLRQMKFDEIKFNQTQKPEGFDISVKEVKKANGQGTNLLFKDREAYSRFSGGSVTFLFKDKEGNTIARDFAGTLNQIENEGLNIKKEFGLKSNELTLGYHDVGSFSAKPKAKNNILSSKQWLGYNTTPGDDSQNPTGGALIIPKQNVKH